MPNKRTSRALFSASEQAAVVAAEYLGLFANHDPFVTDLQELAQRLRLRFPDDPCEVSEDSWIPDAARAEVARFVTRWGLPAQLREELPAILALSRGGLKSAQGLANVMASMPAFELRGLRPYIKLPPEADPAHDIEIDVQIRFTWRIREMSSTQARARVDERLAEARASAVRQLEEAETRFRAAGYRELHPTRYSEDALKLAALRLFQRAALRWSWKQIAREERHDSVSAVKKSVERSASLLDVALPKSPRGARLK